jgi:hypothetical protein
MNQIPHKLNHQHQKFTDMKINKLVILIVLLVPVSSLYAQETPQRDVLPRLSDPGANWFLSVNGGAQILMSQDADYLVFSKRITPMVSISTGKWVSPFMGFRLKLQGLNLNGHSTATGLYLADTSGNLLYGNNDPVREHVTVNPDGSYHHYIRYVNSHLDLLLSLMNILGGYAPERNWDILASAGIGCMKVFEYKGIPQTNSISTNFSLTGTSKISESFHVNLEIQSAFFSDQFEGRIAGKNIENYLSAGIGLSYYFSRKGFHTCSEKR